MNQPSTPCNPQPHPLPRANAADLGFSPSRLARLTERMRRGVASGEIPGAVVLIARRGRIAYEECFGWQDRASSKPMRADALFRIASMTKPITSMAAMMLVEEGRLGLADPVDEYIPAFSGMSVWAPETGLHNTLGVRVEPAHRAMTVHDLLRHTSGLAYGFTGEHPVKKLYLSLEVSNPHITNEEHVARLSALPLMHQPGSAWEYGVSTDVLGRVIEIVSGQPLAQFVAERIAGPLGLPDTAFSAPADQLHRCAFPQPEGANRKAPLIPAPTAELAFKSGGGGMVSTASDYARLCQLWLNGGVLDGVRLLSRATMELMTSNHLPAGTHFDEEMYQFGSSLPSPALGGGFGLGFAVRTAAGLNPLPGSEGLYAWSGIYGTSFWVDPKEELFAMIMLQSMEMRSVYRNLLRNLVYGAIDD